MVPHLRLAAAVFALASLASCASTKQEADAMRARVGGLVAQLRSSATAVTGVARAYDYRDGVQIQVAVDNLIPGRYRVAIHENGNCRSPNLFSAGPAWAPAELGKAPADLLPPMYTNSEGNQNGYVAYVPGLHTDRPPSLRGKSIVIHWGTSVNEAFPGQPNNRVACGVLEWTDPIF